jgi:hypothetical protein
MMKKFFLISTLLISVPAFAAMSKTSMRARIIANIQARNSNLNGVNKAILEPFIEDICDGIIKEIQQNMDITVTVPGVQAGTSTVTGTKQAVN